METKVRFLSCAIATVTTLAVIAALSVSPASGAVSPVSQLQAIDVRLGPNGSVRDITSVDFIRAKGKGGERRKKTRLDPQKRASDLPISVATNYRKVDRVGSDLADLEKAGGPVGIDLTVTNRTGQVREISRVDDLGHMRTTGALVTVPLTVIATAVLPERAVKGIDLAGTNGNVTRRDGKVVVQWAALLAPPALSGSTTFSLAVDAADFVLDEITVSVEPGVHVDFALDRLVDETFGDSARSDELATYLFADAMGRSLVSVRSELEVIRERVTKVSLTRGNELIQVLQSARADLDGQMNRLGGLIGSSTGGIAQLASNDLGRANNDILAALKNLLGSLGYGLGPDGRIAPDGRTDPAKLSVLGLIDRALLRLEGPDGPDVVDALIRQLGTVDGPCSPADRSVQCQINGLVTNLGLSADRLITKQIQDVMPSLLLGAQSSLGTAGTNIAQVDTDLDTARSRLAEVSQGVQEAGDTLGNGANAVVANMRDARITLEALRTAVLAIETQLGAAATHLDALMADLTTVSTALTGPEGLASKLSQLAAGIRSQAQALCDIGDDVYLALSDRLVVGTTEAEVGESIISVLDQVRKSLDGRTCSPVILPAPAGDNLYDQAQAIGVASVTAAVTNAITQLKSTKDALGPARRALGGVTGKLAAAVAQVDLVISQLGEPGVGGTRDKLDKTGVAVRDTQRIVDEIGGPGKGLDHVVGAIGRAGTDLDTLGSTLGTSLRQLFLELDNLVKASGTTQRASTDTALKGSLAAVRTAATEIEREANSVTSGIATRAADDQKATGSGLDATVRRISEESGSLFTTATATLGDTRTKLGNSVAGVFVNLTGNPNPSLNQSSLARGGFQLQILDEVERINQQGGLIEDEAKASSSLGGLRHVSSVANSLRDELQLESLRALDKFGLFAGEAPQGSVTSTAFVFRVGAD